MHLSQIYVSNKGENNQELIVSLNTKDRSYSPKALELKQNVMLCVSCDYHKELIAMGHFTCSKQ